MAAKRVWISLAVLALALTAPYVRAQDGDEPADDVEEDEEELLEGDLPPHPLTDLAEPAPFVDTTSAFVKVTDNKVAIGEETTILCGFTNNGDAPLNVSMIMGSINHPAFFHAYYFQNLTGRWVNETVEPEGDYTFSFKFEPSENFEAADVQLAVTVFYEDDTDIYTSTFYNDTISLFEPPVTINLKDTLTYVAPFAIMGVVALILLRGTASDKDSAPSIKTNAAPAARAAEGTVAGGDDDDMVPEWLRNTKVKKSTSSKEGSPRRRRNRN